MVIWDYAGRVTVALSKELRYLLGPLESKAMAKEEGLLSHWMWASVMLCLSVIQKLFSAPRMDPVKHQLQLPM